jgi:triphosphatase
MEFELTAHAERVAGLGRLKGLAACRDGRARTQSVKIVWHDSPEHALWSDGLALAEQRGGWRLERLVPGDDTWLPAQPAPVVADPPDPARLPSPLAPLAAFEGRRTSSVHRIGDASVTLTVERGILRAVTAQHPVARVLLSGEAEAVHAIALMIVESIPVAVPVASLAAEAIALAAGRPPPPRHTGAPILPRTMTRAPAPTNDAPEAMLAEVPADEPAVRTGVPAALTDVAAALTGVPAALAHIIGHLTDVILAFAPLTATLDATGSEAVHQMRVAVRRARSAVSIFRSAVEPGALDSINDSLRSLGRQLGPSRDWDVFSDETMPVIREALPGDSRLERLAAAVARRRREHRSALSAYLASAEFRKLGIELAWFTATLSARAPTVDQAASLSGFSAAVLQHRWKKLLSSGKRMQQMDIPALHGVRLRAKRARYAAEMFATLYHGKTAHRFIRRLSALQQRLGVLNDGAVATHLLEELGGAGGRHSYAAGVVAGFLAARAGKIRPRIVSAFEKFRRQAAYWS